MIRGLCLLLALIAGLAISGRVGAADLNDGPAVVAEVETGLALLETGQMRAAYDRLNAANEVAQDRRYSVLSVFYPNAALALWFHDQGEYAAALDFAASAVTGLALNGAADHPAHAMAGAVEGVALMQLGRMAEAELSLRRVVAATKEAPELARWHGMALWALARVASLSGLPDQVALRDAFLHGYTPTWRVRFADALHIRFYALDFNAKSGADPAKLLRESAALLATAEARAAELPKAQVMFYMGFHGTLLAQAGQHVAARGFLRRHHDFLTSAGLRNADVWQATRRLTTTLFVTEGPQVAYQFLTAELARAQTLQAPSDAQALYLRELGHLAQKLGDATRAQMHFRTAYATARSDFAANSPLARHLRGFINLDAPGIANFAFAHELRPAAPPSLLADASGVLARFLNGDYAALQRFFAETDAATVPDPAVFEINRALFHAMGGQPDAMVTALDAAWAQAKNGASALSPDAPTFDLIYALGFAFGSEHAPARAANAVNALRKRADQLSAGENLMRLALSAYTASHLTDTAALRSFILRWLDTPRAQAPQGPWEIFANVLALEMAYGNLAPDRLAPIETATLAAMGPTPAYQLARDLNRMAVQVLVATDQRSEEALSRRALIGQALAQALPPGHPVVSAAEFTLATAYLNRGDAAASVAWMDRAITSLRAAPHHDRGRLAYLMARQARALLGQGQVNRAAALSGEALEMVDPDTVPGHYLGELLIARVSAIWQRTERPARAADFLQDWLDRPGLLDRMAPEAQVELLILHAGALSLSAGYEVALAGFARARDTMRMPHWDWRFKLARLDLDQARLQYRAGQLQAAWADVQRANDTYLDWASDVAGGVPAGAGSALHVRATWEAVIGWDLAAQLPAE